MLDAISYGFLTGIFLSIGFGSVFFALIQDSIEYHVWAGIKIAGGVVIGDIMLITFATLGTSFLPEISDFENKARILGIIMLSIMAFAQLRAKTETPQSKEIKGNRNFYFVAKGFLLNVFNPVNFISWAVVSTTLQNLNYTPFHMFLFFLMAVLMVLTVECLVAIFSVKIKAHLSEKTLSNFKYFTAAMFICIALGLAYEIVK